MTRQSLWVGTAALFLPYLSVVMALPGASAEDALGLFRGEQHEDLSTTSWPREE